MDMHTLSFFVVLGILACWVAAAILIGRGLYLWVDCGRRLRGGLSFGFGVFSLLFPLAALAVYH